MALNNILTPNDLNVFSNSLVETQLITAQRLALPQVNGTMVFDNQIVNAGVTGAFMFYQGNQWETFQGNTSQNIYLTAHLNNSENAASLSAITIGQTGGMVIDFLSGNISIGTAPGVNGGVITFNVPGKYWVSYTIFIGINVKPLNAGSIALDLKNQNESVIYYGNKQGGDPFDQILSNYKFTTQGIVNVAAGATIKGWFFQNTGQTYQITGSVSDGPNTYVNIFYLGP